jgi:hypothetical protein
MVRDSGAFVSQGKLCGFSLPSEDQPSNDLPQHSGSIGAGALFLRKFYPDENSGLSNLDKAWT